ncbi:MAG: polysaccharide deacetylase family protein [Candidatus Krumholzibacteriia bacterium]
MATDQPGIFTISLDLELAWGFLDRPELGSYEANLRGGRAAIPALLDLFATYDVHATWATVGLLMYQDRQDLLDHVPPDAPTYADPALDAYRHVRSHDDLDPELHLAPDLIERILAVPGQEIGSHTHCHYYGLEPGQTRTQFRADLEAAASLARRRNLTLTSLVFPRNQCNPDYLELLTAAGVTCYRGNERSRLYRAAAGKDQRRWMRAARLLDAYLPLTGHNTHDPSELARCRPYDVPASRFLRPAPSHAAWLEPLRRRRITRAMTHAAHRGRLFHLWWHPHNFGRDTERNLAFLATILEHFARLHRDLGMLSLNMHEVAVELDRRR